MKITYVSFGMVCAILCLMPFAQAVEKKIRKADLPPAVAKTAAEVGKGAVVKAYSQDNEDGAIEYEVEMIVGGHSKDVTIGTNGRILEVEEQVQMSALAASVQSGLKAKAGGGSITKVESIIKRGTLVAYEAHVSAAGKNSEVQVGPDGKPLDHEE